VAVYTEADREALHVRMADEAFALDGPSPSAGYLDPAGILDCCRRSRADAVHPGWGFLAENGDFAQAVIEDGLTWIGPPPQVIRQLGDKVAARSIAHRTGAPLAPGTPDPVGSASEVAGFAKRHGLPVAIKAAFGGGGRGLKVAWALDEIAERYESAVREAVTAFGRGECYVERYLERPRHVETQCLADRYGNVVVVSTRDCSLQRRHQKLVEEAPAPFLTEAQHTMLYASAKAILAEAGYVGAGTCEYLIGQDGTISFLEVNTRLQVEHPVSEEVTGLDLVREMFRIADDQALGYGDPEVRGHSMEFRINGEDAGRHFLPVPGAITRWRPPSGPGVRLDSGVEEGSVLGMAFDSLLAKLIVTGRDRRQVLERARRALGEFEVGGVATVLPFHRAVVTDPAFTAQGGAFAVHTQWIESEFAADIEPFTPSSAPPPTGPGDSPGQEVVVVEVNRRRVEITLPASLRAPSAGPPGSGGIPREGTVRGGTVLGGTVSAQGGTARTDGRIARRQEPARRSSSLTSDGKAVISPMQGTVVKLEVVNDQRIAAGDLILVLEAMKLEQPVTAHRAGTVTGLDVAVGGIVTGGAVLCTLED